MLKPETGQLSVAVSVVLLVVIGLAVVRVVRAMKRAVDLNCMLMIIAYCLRAD